nr:xylulose kinase-1 [Tanacetum cinerariifolium]
MTTDQDGTLKIRPPVTAEEHQQVQREEKARTILLSALLDEHMGYFYHMIDARDIWNAIKARFGGNAESKKMQKSLLKQRVFVYSGTFTAAATAVSPSSETEFALMCLSTEKLIDQATQEKQDLMTKLDIEIANQAKWNNSEPSTNDFQMYDFSQECLRPNHSDHDSNSSVSAPPSESSNTIVIECTGQEDFPSVCTSSIKTDVKSSKTLCNKFGSFNKGSHFRKHKSCYVCGSYLHLIKDCDLHEQRLVKRHAKGKGILGRRPTWKTVNPNKPKPVSAGKPKPVSAGKPKLVFAGKPKPVSAGKPKPVSAGNPKPVSAGQQNTVSAGPPNPVCAGDRLLGPRPLNIQPTRIVILAGRAFCFCCQVFISAGDLFLLKSIEKLQ